MTKPEDKLSVRTKIGYGLGMISQRLQIGSMAQMANPIFNDLLGVDPRLIGAGLGLARFVAALTDPLVGHLSDNTHSKYGRRRPWIALSALLCSISFSAIWLFPAGMSPRFYLGWFVVTTMVSYIFLGLFSVPYMALGMELTPDYLERTSVMAYRMVVAMIGGLLVSSLFLIVNLGCFHNMAEGMRYTGLGIGLLIALVTLSPVFFSREHPSLVKRRQSRPRTRLKFFSSAKQTLIHPPFLMLIGVTVLITAGCTLVRPLNYYVTIYHVFGGVKSVQAGLVLSLIGYGSLVGALIGIPVMSYATRRIGKRKTLLCGLALATCGHLLKWVCYTPVNPYLSMIPDAIMAFSMSFVWTTMQSMLPEIVDLDELKTDERREGMFSAIHGWLLKSGTALALIASGFVLNASGFNSALGAAQPESAVLRLRICYALIPAGVLIISFVIMYFYPLTEKKAYETRRELDARYAEN